MTHILWVEDQFHWVDKLTPTLESADFGDTKTQPETGTGSGPESKPGYKPGSKPGPKDSPSKNTVTVFKFAEAACQHIKTAKHAPDIAILDANMNGNNQAGFTVSRALIKKWPGLPIIYLSEHSGTDIEQQALDKVETQDFIAKHQDNIEAILCWRIKAAMRTAAIKRGDTDTNKQDVIESGGMSIDLGTWEVYWHAKRLMNPKNPKRPLAPIPRKILKALVDASPRPISTTQMEHLLESDNFTYASYRQHITTLRHAIELAGGQSNQPSFLNACKQGHGIVTFGDDGAYCWKPIKEGANK